METKHTPWEVAAEQITDALLTKTSDVAHKAADELYVHLMEMAREYLKDNVAYNPASHISMLERERQFARDDVIKVAAEREALRDELRLVRGSLLVWIGDVECGVKPTIESLQGAYNDVSAAIVRVSGQ